MRYKNCTNFKIYLPGGDIFLPGEEKDLSDTVAIATGIVFIPEKVKRVTPQKKKPSVKKEEVIDDSKRTS